MGQKVHPHGMRLGIIRTWDSRWFTRRGYAGLLLEDFKIRNFLKKKLYQAALSKIDIERQTGKVTVNLFSARPGIIIGKKGSEVETLRNELKATIVDPAGEYYDDYYAVFFLDPDGIKLEGMRYGENQAGKPAS